MLPNDSRASSLLRGSASRKLVTDRDMHMTLWKNYVVMGCCVAAVFDIVCGLCDIVCVCGLTHCVWSVC